MPPVKSLSRISEKWKNASQSAQGEYEAGVQNTQKDWGKNTAAANDAYKKGIQASIARDGFKKGVENAGHSKWQNNTLAKGPARWAEGISKSTDSFEKGFKPYREVIERTELPARGPKGDPSNINRVAVLAKALHAQKISMTK